MRKISNNIIKKISSRMLSKTKFIKNESIYFVILFYFGIFIKNIYNFITN